MPFISLLQAAPATSSGSLLMTVLPLALIFVIFYFFMIRPQNKKQKETEKMIAALKKGDKVITIGGIHGTVSSTKEKTVIVKVDDNTKIEFLRSAISTVVTDKAEKNGKKDTVEAVTAEAEKAIEEEKKISLE